MGRGFDTGVGLPIGRHRTQCHATAADKCQFHITLIWIAPKSISPGAADAIIRTHQTLDRSTVMRTKRRLSGSITAEIVATCDEKKVRVLTADHPDSANRK